MQEIYRRCAAALVFRPTEAGDIANDVVYDILLLHKPRKNDSWQLPQGGCEAGETLEEAAQRELQEEAGIDVQVLGKSEIVYQYDFPKSYRRFRPDHVKGQRIEFIYALLQPGQVVQVDDNEINDYLWILPDQLPTYIKRKAYLEIVQNLLAEGQRLLPS